MFIYLPVVDLNFQQAAVAGIVAFIVAHVVTVVAAGIEDDLRLQHVLVVVLVRRVGVVVRAVHLERTHNKPTKLFLFLKLSSVLCKL
jgi:hypothetical protein